MRVIQPDIACYTYGRPAEVNIGGDPTILPPAVICCAGSPEYIAPALDGDDIYLDAGKEGAGSALLLPSPPPPSSRSITSTRHLSHPSGARAE